MEPKHFDPGTARDVLAAFFPEHSLHTVTQVRFLTKHVELVCSCGSARRKVYEGEVKTRGWTMALVRNALRNVPPIIETKTERREP
jgi:hypothetical protein